MAVLVLAGVYPVLTLLLSVIGPLTASWQVWQRTLLLAPLMVTLVVYVIIPFIHKRFQGFLRPKA